MKNAKLISVEHELPTTPRDILDGVRPSVFLGLWHDLARDGWSRSGEFAVTRPAPVIYAGARSSAQVITTDTGPTIEFAPSPAECVGEIDTQLRDLRKEVGCKLAERDIALLGSGIHPGVGTSEAEYYALRTPRGPYDYAIRERGWPHRSILNIAAMQEVIDLDTVTAPDVLRLFHRLAGIFLFLFRNDPDYLGSAGGRLSVRPDAWKCQVPHHGRFAADRHKIWLPETEIRSWGNYLDLLWMRNPMFILETKSDGLVYVPEHPTFLDFILKPPSEGWQARRLDNGSMVRVVPEFAHVAQTDWTYMGFARLRIFWKPDIELGKLTDWLHSGNDLDAFVSVNADKVLLENRSSACPLPGEEVVSLAFAAGLAANYTEALHYVDRRPYVFWLALAHAAEFAPLDSHVGDAYVPQLAQDVLTLSSDGLRGRERDESHFLEPIIRRCKALQSPSEEMLALHGARGMEAVLDRLRYRF